MRYVMLNAIYTHADLSVCGYHLMGAETKKNNNIFIRLRVEIAGEKAREGLQKSDSHLFAF